MEAGKLRNYVDIESFTQTSTGVRGSAVGTWTATYENVPASIEDLSGRELELARQTIATATTKIVIRYHSGVTTKQRINHNDKIYNIEFVANPENRNRELILTCSREAE